MNKVLVACSLLVGCAAVSLAAAQSAAPLNAGPAPGGSPSQPAIGAGTRVRAVAAGDAVAEALLHNPSRQSAALEVERAVQSVRAEAGRYPFVFQADGGHTRSSSARLAGNDSVSTSSSRSYTLGAALRRAFPLGTSAEIRLQGERFENDLGATDSVGGVTGDGYGVVARATISQPLLRGAGARVGELELRSARVERESAEKSRARVTSELIRDVLIAYWELWYAEEGVRIEEASLTLARQQEQEAEMRVAQGALAPADVLTFSTRVAQLEESLVGAQTLVLQRSGDLGVLLGQVNPDDSTWGAASAPPPPEPMASRADVELALKAGSVQLAELETQLKLARTRAEVAGETTRPRLDVEGYVQSEGISERVPRAFSRAGELRWVTAHVGVVAELPLDDTRGNAERANALLTIRIAEQSLKSARDRITAQAVFAVSNEQAALRRRQLSERTLEVATRTFEAERARFELGQSIPVQVQQAEEEVRRARLRVARARVDLLEQQIGVLHLTGGLLERYAGPRAQAQGG